jgi:hypothetical protein
MKRARIAAVALNVITVPIAQTGPEPRGPGWNRNNGPCDANDTSTAAGATSKAMLLIAALVTAMVSYAAPAQAITGDQADAEQAVAAVYNQVQRRCTPSMAPSLQSITWTLFSPDSGGEGTIHDGNPSLGGQFKVAYWNEKVGPARATGGYRPYGQWGVNLEFC